MLTPEREQKIRDHADVTRALAPESRARQDGARMLDLLAEIDRLRAELEAALAYDQHPNRQARP